MDDNTTVKTHWSFWVIGIIAVVWNAMGCMNFVVQLSADNLASFPESHRALIEGRPVWATGGFALSVFGGLFGSILLLLRKFIAREMFAVSLLGTGLTMVHSIWAMRASAGFSPFEISLMFLMPLAVSAYLLWYTVKTKRYGWVR